MRQWGSEQTSNEEKALPLGDDNAFQLIPFRGVSRCLPSDGRAAGRVETLMARCSVRKIRSIGQAARKCKGRPRGRPRSRLSSVGGAPSWAIRFCEQLSKERAPFIMVPQNWPVKGVFSLLFMPLSAHNHGSGVQ